MLQFCCYSSRFMFIYPRWESGWFSNQRKWSLSWILENYRSLLLPMWPYGSSFLQETHNEQHATSNRHKRSHNLRGDRYSGKKKKLPLEGGGCNFQYHGQGHPPWECDIVMMDGEWRMSAAGRGESSRQRRRPVQILWWTWFEAGGPAGPSLTDHCRRILTSTRNGMKCYFRVLNRKWHKLKYFKRITLTAMLFF